MGLLDEYYYPYANRLADLLSQETGGYGARTDGTNKGKGFFGELKNTVGGASTELSAETTLMDGSNLLYPLISQNQSFKDMNNLLTGGKPTGQMYDQAIRDALSRKLTGRSPFADWYETRGYSQER